MEPGLFKTLGVPAALGRITESGGARFGRAGGAAGLLLAQSMLSLLRGLARPVLPAGTHIRVVSGKSEHSNRRDGSRGLYRESHGHGRLAICYRAALRPRNSSSPWSMPASSLDDTCPKMRRMRRLSIDRR